MAYEREHTCKNCPTTFIARSARRIYCDPCRVKAAQDHERGRYAREGIERRAAYVEKNKEKLREQARARYHRKKSDPAFQGMVENHRLLARYGISTDERDALAEAQGWGCAICGRTAEEAHPDGRRLQIDHDHLLTDLGMGKAAVRGLLCFDCNVSIGGLFDCPDMAQRLLEYLSKHAARRKELLAHMGGDISHGRSPRTRDRKTSTREHR